jgi:hypothetical protein
MLVCDLGESSRFHKFDHLHVCTYSSFILISNKECNQVNEDTPLPNTPIYDAIASQNKVMTSYVKSKALGRHP